MRLNKDKMTDYVHFRYANVPEDSIKTGELLGFRNTFPSDLRKLIGTVLHKLNVT